MARFVIDANVAIKWVLPEADSERALSFLDNDQDELLVPDFFFSEIANILWKRVQWQDLSLEEAETKLEDLKQVDFKIYDSYHLVTPALKLSAQVNQAIYDCLYLVLAMTNDCQMITADERFINAVRQSSSIDCLVWLGAVGEGGV